MLQPVKVFIVKILSGAAIMGLVPALGQARNIDLDFYRLHPGMATKDISAILGKTLPNRCRADGNELNFESKDGVYTIRLDSRGHFFRMDWRQKRPATLVTEDAFRTLAKRHKCGDGKSFEIEKYGIIFMSRTHPMISEKTHEGFTAEFHGYQSVHLTLLPSLDGKNKHHLSCFRLEESNIFRLEDFCKFSTTPCPNQWRYQIGGGSLF